MTVVKTRLFPTALPLLAPPLCGFDGPGYLPDYNQRPPPEPGHLAAVVTKWVPRNHDWIKFISETKGFWPAFDRGWKSGTAWWASGRLFGSRSGGICTLNHHVRRRHGRGLGAAVFLLSRYRSLDDRPSSWHSLRFLHRRWNREPRRLAYWSAVVVRASSFFWSTDGENLHAKSQPDGQSHHVVGGSYVFCGCPNSGRALGLALGRSGQQAVSSICA